MPRTGSWTVDDAFWARVELLIPPALSHAKGGRPRAADRQLLRAIVYILRTGLPSNAPPRRDGVSASTVHARFQEWERTGVSHTLWTAGLTEYPELRGMEWE